VACPENLVFGPVQVLYSELSGCYFILAGLRPRLKGYLRQPKFAWNKSALRHIINGPKGFLQ
jgi:hypothetical protein